MNAMPSATPRLLLALAIPLALAACQQRPQEAGETPAPTPPVAEQPPPAQPPDAIKPATDAAEATDENVDAARTRIAEAAKAAREQWKNKTFEEFEATVFKEPGENGKYIVDGDIAIADRKQLREFFDSIKKTVDGSAHGKLVVNERNGVIDVWTSAKKKQLTYCVGNNFGARKAQIVADMEAATQEWEKAANVDFIHTAAQDGNCTAANGNVVFDVNPVDVDGEYLARAFFPGDQRAERNVLIDQSSFGLEPGEKLQLVGILRHELGHTLGWRHEHTRPEAGACFEDSEFKPITSYDKFSVMHYPQCNGGGDWSLTLTALDRAGAACIYGKGTQNTEGLGQCTFRVPDAPAGGAETTEAIDNQSVAKDQNKYYGPYSVKPGSIFEIKMSGVGANAGDPDLYTRYVGKPDQTHWICRPYLSHANETCEQEVPMNRSKVYVMVRGYAAGSYKLDVRYVKP